MYTEPSVSKIQTHHGSERRTHLYTRVLYVRQSGQTLRLTSSDLETKEGRVVLNCSQKNTGKDDTPPLPLDTHMHTGQKPCVTKPQRPDCSQEFRVTALSILDENCPLRAN